MTQASALPLPPTQPHHRSALVSRPPTVRLARVGRRELAFLGSLVAAPTAAFLVLRGVKKPREGVIAAAGVFAGLALVRTQLERFFVEEPTYRTLAHAGPLEVRRYAPQLRIVTHVENHNLERALELGYARLRAYLQGQSSTGERLRMMTPVVVKPLGRAGFEISFIAPPGRTLATLPKPTSPHVTIGSAPTQRLATLRFAGRITEQSVIEHEAELRRRARIAGHFELGHATLCIYDPPTTLPALRRNELCAPLV